MDKCRLDTKRKSKFKIWFEGPCFLIFLIYRQELEEVRQEILSLSEKYSYKCVETASLEEKLKLATHQAKQSQQMVQKLEQRFVCLFPKKQKPPD